MIESQATNLLTEAEQALGAALDQGDDPSPAVRPFAWKSFDGGPVPAAADAMQTPDGESFELRIELGHTRMHPDEVWKLRAGDVVPLDELTGEPVTIYAGGRLIARGELLVVNEMLAVRVVELVAV